ncbi:unnamed protein product, partial [Vitis vinifera]
MSKNSNPVCWKMGNLRELGTPAFVQFNETRRS